MTRIQTITAGSVALLLIPFPNHAQTMTSPTQPVSSTDATSSVASSLPAKSRTVAEQGAIRPFTFRTSEEQLADLKRRIAATRWPSKEIVGDQSQGVLPNRFQGREYDAESGLYYFRARYYDPTVGRFISEDPASLLAGVNLYEFVGNNPLNNRDPLGLAKNAEFCNRLLEKIQNVQDRIDKRLRDLDEDPLGLPGSCPGDDVKPSLSREGHQRLINEDKALLDALKAEYLAKCSDEPPNGSPAADESWFDRKYWERVTGLSGAALIAFMIIEVWSRLFPPRNLIPI